LSGNATKLGDGWDGPGQNPVTLFFHFENATPSLGQSQRQVFLDAMSDWASVVQIHFVEVPLSDETASIDVLFARGDHCNLETAECGDNACIFNGSAFGVIAHAAPPPGIDGPCGPPAPESFAGNIHFDKDEAFTTSSNGSGYNLQLSSTHWIGRALGLSLNLNPGDHDVMGTVEWNESYIGLSETDILQIQLGYASGGGSVTTLETLGIWVNSSYKGEERGSPGEPFNTLAEGIAGLPPHAGTITIHMLTGLYPEAVVIDKPCVISADFGPVIIGQ